MQSLRLIIPLVVVLLAGCAGPAIMPPENSSPYSGRDDALGTFLDYAWTAQSQGDYDAADGWLVRAMRINPSEPAVYYRMAVLRKEQGLPDQARQLASRALSLGPDHSMKRDLNLFLRQL